MFLWWHLRQFRRARRSSSTLEDWERWSSDAKRHVGVEYRKALRPLTRYRKNRRVIEALLPDLRQVDPELRGEAARALEAIGWQPETLAQRIDLLIAARRWKEVMRLDAAVERLLEVWKTWIWPAGEGATVAESCAGEDSPPTAVKFLGPLLESERNNLWESLPVSRALMRIGMPEAIDALIYGGIAPPGEGKGVAPRRGKLLCEADGEIVMERLLAALRRFAAELKAGCMFGGARALESIVGALGKLGDARAGDPIRECVQDPALLAQGESDACARLGINADRYEDGSWSRSFVTEANRALTRLG